MRNKKLIRIVAIVLAILLAGGVVVGALVSALAEEPTEVGAMPRDRYAISMEYLADEQALHITQRLIYINPSDEPLSAVVFYAAGNQFRREHALMYDNDDLEAVFFDGYAPAGIDLQSVTFNGEPTGFGFQDEEEIYLRVDCDLPARGQGAFEFDYYLLLMNCGAFQGASDTDVRLSAFYFAPGRYHDQYGEFAMKRPVAHTRWLDTAAADFDVALTLPEGWMPAGTGETVREGESWRIQAENVRELALSFSKRWRVNERVTASGVTLRVLSNARSGSKRALDVAEAAVNLCESWFGSFPVTQLDIAQSDYPLGAMAFPSAVWLSSDLFEGKHAGELAHRLRFAVAQQYFGLAAWVEPSADAWLSDSLCEYLSYLLLEADEGHDAFLKAVNRDWVSALQQTVPGGLRITSDASLFDGRTYDLVVLKRGAVVFHELREAMGLENLLAGLKNFYDMGADSHTLTEMELVEALNAADGGDWEAFLTDWVFNVGDYANQMIDWFE